MKNPTAQGSAPTQASSLGGFVDNNQPRESFANITMFHQSNHQSRTGRHVRCNVVWAGEQKLLAEVSPDRDNQSATAGVAAQRLRAGFTLLELMLVLVILVAIASIMTPALGEIFERQKLRAAGNSLQMHWDQARLQAMRTGQAQVFECEIGTGNFSVKPLMLQSDTMNAGAGATVVTGGAVVEQDANGMAIAADTSLVDTESLDDGIVFQSCLVAGDARAFAVAQESQSEIGSVNDLNISNVAQRVIFYPDGSSSTAEAQLKNERGDVRAIQIRGITGHTRTLQVTNVASGSDS